MREFKSERKVLDIIKEYRANYTDEDMKRLLYAFEKLDFFESGSIADGFKEMYRAYYERDKQTYVGQMEWISEFMRTKGYMDPVFRKPEDFDVSREDWNYFYLLKTKSEYEADEVKRKKIIAEYNRAK